MTEHRGSGVLRVATQNVWGLNGEWPARRARLRSGFAELTPDLIALQETVVTPETDQVAEVLGDEYHILHQREGRSEGLGISLASRWPIDRVHEIDLHVTSRTAASFPCALLVAEIDTPALGPITFANHFPNPALDVEYERELQAVQAAGHLEQLASQRQTPVVLAGDLDAEPTSASVRFWTGRQSLEQTSVCYRDTWESAHPTEPGHTFTPEHPLVRDQVFRGQAAFHDWPFRRVDYIFVRFGGHCGGAPRIRSCERIFDRPDNEGVWASDHFGVLAELAPPR